MAAAGYTTDLVTIDSADTVTGWTEPTGSIAGGTPAAETDYFIQGTGCVSKTFNATGLGGLGFLAGAGVTIPTDGAVYVWVYFSAPNALTTKALGGMQVLIGSAAANYTRYYVTGSNTYTYGGWVCFPVNPTIAGSATQGTPTATRQYFGMSANVANAISKGNPCGVDVIRYGRGTLQVINGDLANGYATFSGAATTNDLNSGSLNRWGILSFVDGVYKMQGHLSLGVVGTAVDFRDSNKNVIIQNTEFVTTNFNTIEVRNASSRVDFTGVSVSTLSTVSKGRFLVTENATINLASCTFTDMGTFTFLAATIATSTIFRRCELITTGGATFTDCIIDSPSGTIGMTCSILTIGLVTNTRFISKGTGYAIEVTGTATNFTLSGVTFTGFAASNGSTGNEAVFVNIASGTISINITNGGNTPSIRTAGATVTVVNSKTFTITNIVSGSEVRILRQSDLVELAGAEVVSASPSGQTGGASISTDPDNAGRFRLAYSYGYTSDIPIFVVVFNVNYQPLRPSATLKSTDGSLQVAQTIDRQYLNP